LAGAAAHDSRASSADFGHPKGIARRTCAIGLQAQRCVVVGVLVEWPPADEPIN
jgi:hypothetical protein